MAALRPSVLVAVAVLALASLSCPPVLGRQREAAREMAEAA